jgi:hypothetical protein
VKLVAGEREEINAPRLHINGYFSDRLNRIGMKQHAFISGNPGQLFDRLKRAGFIVGRHYAHEAGLLPKGCGQLFRTDDPVSINRKIGYSESLSFQPLASIDDGWMFDGGCDYMVFGVGARESDTFDDKVIPFGTAAVENQGGYS